MNFIKYIQKKCHHDSTNSLKRGQHTFQFIVRGQGHLGTKVKDNKKRKLRPSQTHRKMQAWGPPHFSDENEGRSVVSDSLRPMGCRVHGPVQARTVEWVAFPFPRGPSLPRYRTQVSRTAGESLPAEPQGKPNGVGSLSLLHRMFLTQGLLHCRWTLYQLNPKGSLVC